MWPACSCISLGCSPEVSQLQQQASTCRRGRGGRGGTARQDGRGQGTRPPAHQATVASREPVHSWRSSLDSARALTPAQCCSRPRGLQDRQNKSDLAPGLWLRHTQLCRACLNAPSCTLAPWHPLTPTPWLRRNRKLTRGAGPCGCIARCRRERRRRAAAVAVVRWRGPGRCCSSIWVAGANALRREAPDVLRSQEEGLCCESTSREAVGGCGRRCLLHRVITRTLRSNSGA